MIEQEAKGTVVIDQTMTFDDNDLCFLLTGMNMEQFAEMIVHDTTGKYDFLYEDAS